MNLIDYVKVYDNALPKEFCDLIIQEFESSVNKHERHDNNGHPNFTQLNLTKYFGDSSIHSAIVKRALFFKHQYIADTGSRMFPEVHGWEEIRMKKYNNDGIDRFDEHIDACDLESSKRFLVMFWYLNDVDEGGETVFTAPLNISVKPKAGRILMFPPMWMYPHAGMAPKSNSKYIIGSYLHYK
jgi:hypothetical protein